MDDELTILGKKIIEAVGLPLVQGTPKRFAQSLTYYKASYRNLTKGQFKKEIEKTVDEITLIPILRLELERLLIEYGFFHDGAPWRQHMVNIFKEIDNDYPLSEKPTSQLVEEICATDEPLPVHMEIAHYYETYFGKKPTYTYSELKGYVGPFWNFVRSLRDDVGLNISEAAIRKANQRLKKKGQETNTNTI